ncbi:hypothetical protein AAFC00_004011 [Neodothiora populina]|uniref:Uncharacterized protein n=1 Tax=Neodothiora populina TaxID=2781224 RepID=A0ABR3PIB7_9PEZI
MSILSKIKGEKKDSEQNTNQPQEQKRPDAITRRSWTAGDMRQLQRTAMPPISRTNSELSMRSSKSSKSSKYRLGRPSSSLGRNVSFQGLAKVLEDHDDGEDGVPPVPAMPLRYSSASSSRPSSSRGPYSAKSTPGKSPLSSAESTPPDSEDSSNASSKSEDVLEMRSHPFSSPEQFVFRKSRDFEDHVSKDWKGKAPMYGSNTMMAERATMSQHSPEAERDQQPDRRYFTHASPTGPSTSQMTVKPAPASSKDTATRPTKKNKFSFFKKEGSSVAAH